MPALDRQVAISWKSACPNSTTSMHVARTKESPGSPQSAEGASLPARCRWPGSPYVRLPWGNSARPCPASSVDRWRQTAWRPREFVESSPLHRPQVQPPRTGRRGEPYPAWRRPMRRAASIRWALGQHRRRPLGAMVGLQEQEPLEGPTRRHHLGQQLERPRSSCAPAAEHRPG